MSATPFTNEDFRKLVETPRAQRGGETPSRFQKSSISFGGASKTKEAPRNEKSSKPKKPHHRPVPRDEEPLKEIKDKYRDRADERRRREENPNYEWTEDSVDTSQLSVEKTKFLGGDMQHTYLVKGLDYVLMEKTRREAEEAEAKKRAARSEAAAAAEPEVMPRSLLARNIYEIAVRRPKLGALTNAAVREQFLPKRMAFLYEFYSNTEPAGGAAGDASDAAFLPPIPSLFNNDAPSTIYRSKAECPLASNSPFGGEEALQVLQRISKVLNYSKALHGKGAKEGRGEGKGHHDDDDDAHRLSARQKPPVHDATASSGVPSRSTLTRNDAVTSVSAAAAADAADATDDVDIFDDAGRDYVPSVKGEAAKALAGELGVGSAGSRAAASREEDDMDLEEGDERPPAPPPLPPSELVASAQGHPTDLSFLPGPTSAVLPQFYQEEATPYDASASSFYSGSAGASHGGAGSSLAGSGLSYDERLRQESASEQRWRVQRRTAVATDEDGDAYGELLPGSGLGATFADSDEEEDFDAMDVKGKGKSRADFGTDEEWQRYKEAREQLPKAAFQFGVKRADGRKSHKALLEVNEKKQKVKIDTQMRQIDKILQDKGINLSEAFGRTPSRHSDEDASQVKKRQRM